MVAADHSARLTRAVALEDLAGDQVQQEIRLVVRLMADLEIRLQQTQAKAIMEEHLVAVELQAVVVAELQQPALMGIQLATEVMELHQQFQGPQPLTLEAVVVAPIVSQEVHQELVDLVEVVLALVTTYQQHLEPLIRAEVAAAVEVIPPDLLPGKQAVPASSSLK